MHSSNIVRIFASSNKISKIMEKKYIVVISRRGRKRAVEIRKASVEDARKHVEEVMRVNSWTDAELYENDCLTPAMEDGFIIDSSAHFGRDGEIKWKIYKLKPKTVRS